MSQKTIPSKPIIYLGIGRNKYYDVTSDKSNMPIEFFPNGLFLRFSQNTDEIHRLFYAFFETNAQKSIPAHQRMVLLNSQYFDKDCYIACYFKTPAIIYSFLEKFTPVYTFKESGSNIIINKDMLTARIQSLM